MTGPVTVIPELEPFSTADPGTYESWPGSISVITTLVAATVPMLVTRTRYSSSAPTSAVPPPTTATCLVIVSICAFPTVITVGWYPLVGLPSASVGSAGNCAVTTLPWLLIIVPEGTPALTCTLKVTMPVPPAASVPPLDGGEGGVWPEETTPM